MPGLVYKLAPMDERIRKLPHVRKDLWEGIFGVCEVKDVFIREAGKYQTI